MKINKPIFNKWIEIKKSKILRTWMLSYLSILLLPILISSYAYVHTYNIIKTEINTNNKVLLEQIRDLIDSNIKDLSTISVKLQIDNLVNSLSYAEKLENKHHLYMYQLKQDLGAYKAASGIIKEINLYFTNIKTILNTSDVINMDLLPYFDNPSISTDMWKTIITKQKKNRVYYSGRAEFIFNVYENPGREWES